LLLNIRLKDCHAFLRDASAGSDEQLGGKFGVKEPERALAERELAARRFGSV